MTRKNLQSIMNLAWRFVKINNMTMSNALKLAWRNAKLYRKLCTSTVTFEYIKNDGSIRHSIGTLSVSQIPAQQIPSGRGAGRTKNSNAQTYYDMDKNAWRSFKRANLVSISI